MLPIKPKKHTSPKSRSIKRTLVALILPCFILALWEIAARNGWFPTSILPPPSKVAIAFWTLLFNGSLLWNALISTARLLAGLVGGSIVGVVLGFVVGMNKRIAPVIEPTVTALIPVPAVAWIPLLIIFFGIGETTNVLLLGIGSFCVLFLQTLHGVRGIDRRLVEVGQVHGKSSGIILWHILLPGAKPEIFLGLRIALALSWTLLVASEMIASSSGLGWLIWNSRNFSRADEMLAGMIAVALLGKATQYLLDRWQRKQLRWRSTFEDLNG